MKSIIKIILICLFLIIAFCRNVYSQTDTIYTIVEDDSVTIHQDQTFRNCGALYRIDVQLKNFTMNVFEVDTGQALRCMCYFDLFVKTGPFLPGEYTVDIYETNRSGNTSYLGSTNFTIEGSGSDGNPSTLSQFQSNCYEINEVDQSNEIIPEDFSFSELYPNPFNPVTNIKFSIPVSGYVEINVYNLLGQKVTSLLNKYLQAGKHSLLWDGSHQPGGIYLVRLKYDNVIRIRKAVLLK